ncbi:uncharacterized protein LOC123871232 [Maniola jurtina]|uniref:uncharacterized protein LOC123871232 n=1 Tax=Maniola jurtina TaxID=191418 RepID=UPI001E6899F5|nr:uncharacterized protein LOC123871232 [Maniola jurtina]
MVNWDAEDIKQFKKEARTSQQEYCDLLGDREWDVIENWEWNILRRKVGFGLYGPPAATPTSDNRNTGYDKEQLDVIEKICDQLVENLNFKNNNIRFACIFVVMKVFDKRYTVPVFKAKRDVDGSSGCVFVDTGARKYADWQDYLSNNTLQKCIYCYPTRGLYEYTEDNEVRVSFGTSPACDFISRVFSIFDTAATCVTVVATGVGVAALCTVPVAGPILAATAVAGATTGAYGVTRSSYALYDRAAHSQSIAFTDAEARGCWLSIVGSSLGFAQGRMIASMTQSARLGEVMGKAGRIAFLVVQTGSLTVNGIGIIHGLAVLIDKSERNELTPLDVFQFSASVLFFTNAAINLKTASTIIKEVQHDVIDGHRQVLSKDAKKLFNKQTGKLRGPDEMHGNAKVVKQLNRIENSKDLYEMMSDKNVANHKVKLTPDGFKGMLEVNKNLKIHPLKLLEIPPASRQAIFDSTKKFASGTLTKDEFHKEIGTYCKKHQIAFESMREETMKKLCQIYGKEKVNDIVVGGKKIFANATPHEIDRLRVVLENTAKNDKTIIDMATEFARTRGCTTTKDFLLYTEYFVADLNETVSSYEAGYQKSLAASKAQLGKAFNQAKFDQEYGMERGVGRVDLHRQRALDQFKTPEGYEDLNKRYETLKSKVSPWNQNCQPGFFGDDAATYHYLKHYKDFKAMGKLTIEQYFKLAEEVVGNPTNQTNAMLSQDGSCVMITYLEPQRGVRAVKIDRQGDSGIATVMYQKVKKDN